MARGINYRQRTRDINRLASDLSAEVNRLREDIIAQGDDASVVVSVWNGEDTEAELVVSVVTRVVTEY